MTDLGSQLNLTESPPDSAVSISTSLVWEDSRFRSGSVPYSWLKVLLDAVNYIVGVKTLCSVHSISPSGSQISLKTIRARFAQFARVFYITHS